MTPGDRNSSPNIESSIESRIQSVVQSIVLFLKQGLEKNESDIWQLCLYTSDKQ